MLRLLCAASRDEQSCNEQESGFHAASMREKTAGRSPPL